MERNVTEDIQANSVSISGELTQTGVKASIMSRAVSAWDRLWGAKADKRRAPIDADIAETTALSAARVKMIDALGDMGVDRLKNDPEFAAGAMENFLPSLLRRQENKDAVLELAAEDLKQNPGTEQEAQAGPEKLNEAFLNRFERYAEDATDDEVRERWAKVLASEIRQPGTFSGKVLRVIDELEPSILSDNLGATTGDLALKISAAMPQSEIRQYLLQPSAKDWVQITSILPKQPPNGT
jgi:hypothetical protein